MFKWRLWLWAMWGPDFMRDGGWRFSILILPRPNETPEGEIIRSLLRIEGYRDGPSLFLRDGRAIDSRRWTGLEYEWPPRISVAL